MPTQPRQRLRTLLDAVRRRWRTQAALRGAGRMALAAALPILCASAIAGIISPEAGPLAILLVATVLMSFAAAIAVAIRTGVLDLLRPASDVKVARFIEERVNALRDRPHTQPLDDVLVSAVERPLASDADDHADDGGFRTLVVASAADRLTHIGPERIVPGEALRTACLELLGGVAVLVVAMTVASGTAGRAIQEAWAALFPGSISVQVLPGNARIRAGSPMLISASVSASGKTLDRVTPMLTLIDASREERTVPMVRVPGASMWMYEAPVQGTFRYRVTAGSARSQEYTVTALLPPRAQRIELDYEYPKFANLAPRHEDDGGDIYAPSGTTVRLRIHTDKPIASGRLTLRGGEHPLSPSAERVLEGRIVLTRDDSYRIALADRDGQTTPGETEYFIRVMDDRPPDVRITRPGDDQQITPLEEVAIEARADDDHGIAKLELVYAVAGRPPVVVPLAGRSSTTPQQIGTHVIAVEDLRVQPGDVISYYARARDVGRGKPSSEARSDMFFLEVRPFSEEFVNAQSQNMAGAAGDQIEGLIEAQKEIISATWSIERRAAAGAGRSTSDLAAIAGAQLELKGRAEQMAPSRGRGPIRYPMQVQPLRQPRAPQTNDPVSAAIAAMSRAVDHLQGQKPADALTHEMAALQGLLQAQAEIRRREVGQASAGAGGMGRQGQDLSALFDKELQRQQRTNYETQSRAEETPDRLDRATALERIRDLARRQQEVSDRQRALANANASPEERKRELERLTREQEQLRQQADDLARQLSQQRSSSNASRDQSNEMRSAAEQMRGAASDLQREDAAGAAERAGRAAAQLRRLEQQLQSDNPDSRDRAAGELRMEAQQIADEQQRIASEAERLDKGAADHDALRRLAGEKEKLADRVEELRRSSMELSAAGRGEAGEQAAGLAKAIEDQKIAARMRETAKQMRDQSAAPQPGRAGAPAPRKLAGAEQQIAQALTRALDRLGGARTGDAEISQALDRTRRMREDLDRAEQRLREAEAKAARGTGRQASGAASGANASQDEVRQRREEYAQAAQRTQQELSRLERGAPGGGLGGTSPEGHEWSVTDQGTEAFKQDFTSWEALKKNVESALERYEAATVARAMRSSLQDRLNGGGSDRVPDAYRKLIARYYESLARKK